MPRRQVRNIYNELHQRRVVHHDVSPRHVGRRSDGSFVILDLEGAKDHRVASPAEFELAKEEDCDALDRMLDGAPVEDVQS